VQLTAVPSKRESAVVDEQAKEPAALVVCHEVQVGAGPQYEEWLRSVRAQCRGFAGHLGAEVIRPAAGSCTYTVVVRFDSIDHLDAWLASPERKAAIDAIQPLLSGGDQRTIQAGFDHWFTPTAALPAPRRYKQYMVMVSAVFPLTVFIPLVFGWALRALGLEPAPLLMKLLTAMVMVALMVWVVFPVITARLSRWLTR
jgi:uncharacterized protein